MYSEVWGRNWAQLGDWARVPLTCEAAAYPGHDRCGGEGGIFLGRDKVGGGRRRAVYLQGGNSEGFPIRGRESRIWILYQSPQGGGFDVCNEWPQKSPTTGPQNSPLARLGRCSSTCAMNGSGGPRLVASLMRRRKEPLRWRAALAPLLLCDKCNKVPVVPCGVCSRGATLLPCV